MKTKLDYISGKSVLPPNTEGISPSQFARFFKEPHKWYDTEILGNEGFTGSTASVLGTLIHFIAEDFTKTQKVDSREMWKYLFTQGKIPANYEQQFLQLLEEFDTLQPAPNDETYDDDVRYKDDVKCDIEELLSERWQNPDIDADIILQQYKPMGNALIQYIRQNGLPAHSEELIHAEVIPGYHVCGSCDAAQGNKTSLCIEDYKTTSALTPPKTIPYAYKLQLLCYAYIYTALGYKVDRIRIIWITRDNINRTGTKGNKIKDYPATCTQTTEYINLDDIRFITSLLKLVAETMQKSKENPSLNYLLYKDYRLK